ncbi:hypothetical protein EYF80_042958 [Liparis tanakae]|uniref:Uncharacterized protein n=1 Tax=Liparis tanakae TaxID=230148 RepID=A0A4Z2G015_9TELE|nr:hypothetical protein EYF80_042958 [Liparis tanakae]
MRGPNRFGQHSSLMQVFLQKSATRSTVRTISTVARASSENHEGPDSHLFEHQDTVSRTDELRKLRDASLVQACANSGREQQLRLSQTYCPLTRVTVATWMFSADSRLIASSFMASLKLCSHCSWQGCRLKQTSERRQRRVASH